MHPVAPYENDIDKALRRVFDRSSDSVQIVPKKLLRTGKETDGGWEEAERRCTEDEDTVLIYPSSSLDRDRMIERIKSLGKRELMREARIAMRTIDAARAGKDLADEDLKRMADAAERIAKRRKARDEGVAAAVAWLKVKREEIGLVALAKVLDADAANLAKVIEGKRRPSRALLAKIDTLRPQNALAGTTRAEACPLDQVEQPSSTRRDPPKTGNK